MNIWRTIEVDAWSRDFKYEDYLAMHKEIGEVGAVLSEKAYYSLCDIMELEIGHTE